MPGVKASRNAWLRLFKAMLARKGKSRIDAVTIDFADGGLRVRQMDPSRIIAVVIDAEPGYFEAYNQLGSIQVNPGGLIEVIEDHFKDEAFIEVEASGDELVLRGEAGTTYREPLLRVEEAGESVIPDDLMAEYRGVPYIARVKPAYLYEFDSAFIKSIKKKWERITFTAGGPLRARVDLGTGTVEKLLAASPAASEHEGQLSVALPAEELALMGQSVEGAVRLLLTIDEDGEAGPVVLSWRTASMRAAYIVTPLVE